MPKIDQTTILRCPLPLASLAEQERIATEVAERLSQIEAAEIAVDRSLRRAARLRQSILKRAFEGKLVPQDPKDEPANVLLERLKTTAGRSDTIKADGKSAAKRLRRFATTTTKEIEP